MEVWSLERNEVEVHCLQASPGGVWLLFQGRKTPNQD